MNGSSLLLTLVFDYNPKIHFPVLETPFLPKG